MQKRQSDLCVRFAEFSVTIRKHSGALFFLCLQCDKNRDTKKRRSGQAEAHDALQQEAESCYQLRLPEDFYQFWKFCEELDPEKPTGRLCDSQWFLAFPFLTAGREADGAVGGILCFQFRCEIIP